MKFVLASLVLALAIIGCQLGPQIEDFEPARRPEGISANIELRRSITGGGHLEGELLEVRADGLLLNTRRAEAGGRVTRRLVFVPYTAIETATFDELSLHVLEEHDSGTEGIAASAKSPGPDREKLRLLSRFPQGLSPALLEKLLAAEGQAGVEVIGGK
jgi:hypothetical protein